MKKPTITEIVEEFAEKFVKVPCDCPKGGRIGEQEYICPKCNGAEWVADKTISDWLTQSLTSLHNATLDEAIGALGEEKPDLDLSPGFNITAEYRLGEIRGSNTALRQNREALEKLKAR